ncbi:alpha/beta hydrolase [Sphingomonas jatrophae]|uniref:Acetyl esterase/lipase n=1 Tax=Sphingomonas jatrophae TaxID=1166337 RepID=A0A1I6K093_9SPHN|nr:alpha/beta hydrolase [Sphingomonas jatrophae]SFR84528.1 Acetyl esterase/lipase [Sphingomonas jatrophae]
MTLDLTPADLAAARQLNRRLAHMPRFRIRSRVEPLLYQSLLKLSQIGADRRVRSRGVQLHTLRVGADRVRLRVLTPPGPLRGVVLDIHGGGWVIGNAALDDARNAALARACGVAVISVDYRLATVKAPLRPLLDDCFAAATWLLREAVEYDGLPVIVTGESAGGHLAAATLQHLRDGRVEMARIAGALLYYGVYDLSGLPGVRIAGPETLVLHGPGMLDALRLLTPGLDDAGRRAPALSPLYGDLAGMPPALMVVGALDPLIDDTVEMAERWRRHAPVELHVVPDAPHGFVQFATPVAAKLLARAAAWVNERLAAGR